MLGGQGSLASQVKFFALSSVPQESEIMKSSFTGPQRLVEEHRMLPIKTILHPTDFSEGAALAFRLACSLARHYHARLVVVHVVEPPHARVQEGVVIYPPAEDRKLLHAQLEQVRPEDSAVAVEHRLVIDGDAATQIVRLAGEIPCDLIVMGTHGRTGLSRVLMGSVAEQVMRKAPCPVLTVKIPKPVAAPATAEDATASSTTT